MTVAWELRPLGADLAADFERVTRLSGAEAAKCLCTAAFVPYWKDPSLARPCRERILAAGPRDGYLAYDGGEAVGWAQAAPRDALPYYRERSRAVDAGPDVFAVTCLLLVPRLRRQGLAHELLRLVLDDLRHVGARAIHAFACRYREEEDTSGSVEFPEGLCLRAGLPLLEDHPTRPMYGWLRPSARTGTGDG